MTVENRIIDKLGDTLLQHAFESQHTIFLIFHFEGSHIYCFSKTENTQSIFSSGTSAPFLMAAPDKRTVGCSFADIKRTDTFGAVDLVSGYCQKIHSEIVDIDRYFAERLHGIRRVILINHEDCGMYGPAGTDERHEQDLKNAKEKIRRLFHEIEVDTYFLHLNGVFERH